MKTYYVGRIQYLINNKDFIKINSTTLVLLIATRDLYANS